MSKRAKVAISPELQEVFGVVHQMFRDKFGRDPLPGEPILFDPSKDVPTPISRENMADWLKETKILPDHVKEALKDVFGKEDTRTSFHPIIASLRNKEFTIVRNMIKDDKSLLDYSGPQGWSPLFYAVAHGDLPMVEWLLFKGANINHQDYDGWVCMMEAIQWKHEDIVRFLLDRNCDLNIENCSGFTPTHFAGMHLNAVMFDQFRACGADMKKPNYVGMTPLDMFRLPRHKKAVFLSVKLRIP